MEHTVELEITSVFMFVDCKLARAGPPATIVPIDEESRNGECATLSHTCAIICFTPQTTVMTFKKSTMVVYTCFPMMTTEIGLKC